MFAKLFSENGLSLDRLKALLEVGAAGSIVKAAEGDLVRQSQYSRQIKELEDFFRTRLIERQGKGTRLTARGKELSRISRFFMLGLSNFQLGCLAEEQTFRVGAGATFIRQFLLASLSNTRTKKRAASYATEVASDEEIERRLHDLTLDFGVVNRSGLSRPLQMRSLGEWRLTLWIPKAWNLTEPAAVREFETGRMPLILAHKELASLDVNLPVKLQAFLVCDSFVEAITALAGQAAAALLPDFLVPADAAKTLVQVRIPKIAARSFQYQLAWNPRLLRLNPHAGRRRDILVETLSAAMPALCHPGAGSGVAPDSAVAKVDSRGHTGTV